MKYMIDVYLPGCGPRFVGGLLGFLTLRKGDTDDEWFDEYSEEHWHSG